MRDYLAALVPLLQEGRCHVEGETITARYQVTGPRPTRAPSVVLAALGPRMLELAGSYAAGTILWMTGPVTIRDHIRPTIGPAAPPIAPCSIAKAQPDRVGWQSSATRTRSSNRSAACPMSGSAALECVTKKQVAVLFEEMAQPKPYRIDLDRTVDDPTGTGPGQHR